MYGNNRFDITFLKGNLLLLFIFWNKFPTSWSGHVSHLSRPFLGRLTKRP